jgi:hypothetical protein
MGRVVHGRVVHGASRPWGELSMWQNDYGASFAGIQFSRLGSFPYFWAHPWPFSY